MKKCTGTAPDFKLRGTRMVLCPYMPYPRLLSQTPELPQDMMVSVLYIQYSTPIWNYGLVPSFKLLKAETLRNLSSNCPPPSIHPPSRDCAESLSRVQLFASPWTVAHQAPLFMGFLFFQARILEWVACPPPGDLPNPGIKPGLLHCRRILYHLSHQGSPRILEWAAYPFTRGSSQPRNWTQGSCIAGQFFTSWATREDLLNRWQHLTHISWVVLQIWKPPSKWKEWTTWWPWAHTPGFQELTD